MNLTSKSKDHVEFMLQHYSKHFTYRFSDTYFIKLIYVLLCKAEEEPAEITVHHAPLVKFPLVIPPLSNTLLDPLFDHYRVQLNIAGTLFEIEIYTTEPLGRMLLLIRWVLTLCCKNAPDYKMIFYMTPFQKIETTPREMVIFQEEWLKTLIHECFRRFCLNEIDLDYRSMLKPMFHVESTYSLSESFCEFWARTLNSAIFSFLLKKNIPYEEFEGYFQVNLNLERMFGMIQMKQYLSHFNLEYKELMKEKRDLSVHLSEFERYVLTPILFCHFQQTMNWFVGPTETLLQFTRKPEHIYLFCHYLKSIYSQDKFLNELDQIQEYPEPTSRSSIFELV